MKFDIDWEGLESKLNPTPARELKFASVKSQFRKIALDVYEKIGETGLWELRDAEDGTKVLVALYEDAPIKTASLKGNWTASPSSSGDSVTLHYKSTPVKLFKGAEFGFSTDQSGQFASFIVAKATANQDQFVIKLAKSLPERQCKYVLALTGHKEFPNE